MATLETLLIQLGMDSSGVTTGAKKAQGALQGFASKAQNIGSKWGLPFTLGAAAAGAAVIGFVKDSVTAFTSEQEAIAKTNAILLSTGGVANVTAAHMDELTGSLQDQVLVEDDVIRNAANLILTFKNVANAGEGLDAIFDRATEAALDLSSAGFGDLDSAAKMLGKALNDPVLGMTALTRAGVTFSQGQKDTIKAMVEANDVLGAQKLILAEVESQVGGVAKATADVNRDAKTFGIVWGEVKETVGGVVVPILGDLGSAVTFLGPAIQVVAGSAGKLLTIFLGYRTLKALPALIGSLGVGLARLGVPIGLQNVSKMTTALGGLKAAAGPAFAVVAGGTLIFEALQASAAKAEAATLGAVDALKSAAPGSAEWNTQLAMIAQNAGILAGELEGLLIPQLEEQATWVTDAGVLLTNLGGDYDTIGDKALDAGGSIERFAGMSVKAFGEWSDGAASNFDAVGAGLDALAGKAHLTAQKVIAEFTRQAATIRDYESNLGAVAARNIPDHILQQLIDMGTDGAAMMALLAGASDKQFARIVASMSQAGGAARSLESAFNDLAGDYYVNLYVRSFIDPDVPGSGQQLGGPTTKSATGPSFTTPEAGRAISAMTSGASGGSTASAPKTLNVYVENAYGLDDLDRKVDESLTRTMALWEQV